jgi:zinc protease
VIDTIVYNQGIMIDSVAQAIINRRLEARARSGGSFLLAQVSQEKVSRSVDATFVFISPLDQNWQAALNDARGVIADAMAVAPTQEEIDREVAEMNVAFESSVEQRELLAGSRLADDMVTALDINETIASPETVLSIFDRSKPLFTPQAVLDHTRKLFEGAVTRGIYVATKDGEADAAALHAALAKPVEADAKARLASKTVSFADLPAIGTPAAPALVQPSGVLEIERVEFPNGVKVLLWPTADEPGRVTLKARFGAGYRAFGPNDAAYVRLGEMALVPSGEGSLGQEELDRISTGRKMGFNFEISDGAFEFSADTRSADLADQLYLFAAKFAMPRWDAAPFLRSKAAAKLQYDSYAASPQGVIERDLMFYQRGRDPRFHTPTPAEIEAATPEGFRKVWAPLLARGPIELQLFGDFDRDQAIAALGRTFGALPARGALPRGTAPAKVRTLAPSLTPLVLTHHGDAGQAAALVAWPTGGGIAGIKESRQLEILTQLFQNRLMDALREKLGEAYSPQVINNWATDLDNGGTVMALSQLSPKAVPTFFQTTDEIAADLIARPPSQDELDRVIEPLRQQLTRASSSSAFFMYHLEGASGDPRRFETVRSLLADYTSTTPEAMQQLARKYLARGSSWRIEIVPQDQALAKGGGSADPAPAQAHQGAH